MSSSGMECDSLNASHHDFQTIYDEFQPKIRRYLSRLVGATDAEDLTQELLKDQRVTFELVLSHLRRRDFAVLSTVSKESKSHSVGVKNYGVSRPGRDFVIEGAEHRAESERLAARPLDQTVPVVSPTTHHPVARSSRDRGLDGRRRD